MCEQDLCIFITFYIVSSFKLLLLLLSSVFMTGIIWFTQFNAVQTMILKYTIWYWKMFPPFKFCQLFRRNQIWLYQSSKLIKPPAYNTAEESDVVCVCLYVC